MIAALVCRAAYRRRHSCARCPCIAVLASRDARVASRAYRPRGTSGSTAGRVQCCRHRSANTAGSLWLLCSWQHQAKPPRQDKRRYQNGDESKDRDDCPVLGFHDFGAFSAWRRYQVRRDIPAASHGCVAVSVLCFSLLSGRPPLCLAGAGGFELPTRGFKVRCSTLELRARALRAAGQRPQCSVPQILHLGFFMRHGLARFSGVRQPFSFLYGASSVQSGGSGSIWVKP